MRRRAGGLGLAIIAWLLVAGLAIAAPTSQQVQEAERAKAAEVAVQRDAAARAATAAAEEERLGRERVALVAQLRGLEAITETMAQRIASLLTQRAAAEDRLAERAAALGPFLPLIERLGLFPAETLLATPMAPEQSVRGLMVLEGMTRTLEAEAAKLRAEQAELDRLHRDIETELPGLQGAQVAQSQAGRDLDARIAAARDARRAADWTASEAERRAAAAARAGDLRAALARLDEARAKADADQAVKQRRDGEADSARARAESLARPAGPGLGAPRGALLPPVVGPVVRGFGEASDGGPAAGLSYQPAPGARVVSPCPGRVVYGGVFRSFGLLLIIDCGAGYHFVLSGFERLDAQVGQSVQPGEPVGQMPGWDPRAGSARPSLYLELRRDGQPVNPAPYLRAKG